MAKLIKTDGTETEVHPVGKRWTLQELQGHVGGYIEMMPGIGKMRMLLDEEGLLKMKPVNRKATDIVLGILAGKVLRYEPLIVGDVLILEKGEKM
jgi:hypothetical protein